MYGSYGSYSSMSIPTAPIDIYNSSSRNGSIMRAHESACAFPSWPRRSTLDCDRDEPRATSYLSDDDLFPSDPLDDDAHSVSSSSGSSNASPASHSPRGHMLNEAQLLEMDRQRHEAQREAVRLVIAEKERRRLQQAAMKKQRRGSGGSKKSPKSKLGAMAPIVEAAE